MRSQMNSESGINIRSSRLRRLRPVLKKWIRLNSDLAKRWAEIQDVPWWYRERALLSVLSGAVWLRGGVALEEYTDVKRVLSRHGRLLPRSYTGRVDFYFETSGEKFMAEAKHIWVAATQHRSQRAKLGGSLEEACHDIKKLKPSGMRRLAIVFAAPYVTIKSADSLYDHVQWVLSEVQKVRADAVAWTFPKLGKYGRWRNKVICPGIAMLIREVRK